MADQTAPSDSDFQAFSKRADDDATRSPEDAGSGGNRRGDVARNLKQGGTDTGRMAEAADQRVGDLQQVMIDEVRARPLRALCWAATAGLVAGLLWSR